MWISEWQHGATQHQCGQQLQVCSDPNIPWHPQRRVCYVTMNEAAAQRRYKELHEKHPYHDGTFSHFTAEATRGTPYHYQDGVEIYVSLTDLNPEDQFLDAPDPFASVDET